MNTRMIRFDVSYRAVYGYEGQTNVLKVVSSGKGGLTEMIEELNEGSIMYAFCRVIDTKTTLPKCLLINWVTILQSPNLIDPSG